MLVGACRGQEVTEVELTPAPATQAIIASFMATDDGAALADVFQKRDGQVDIRIQGGETQALTNIADDDTATAERICAAIRAAAVDPGGGIGLGRISVAGASDLTVLVC